MPFVILISLLFGFSTAVCAENSSRPSVLFINIDDLNDWTEVLQGHPQAITPNLKRLSEQGLTFTKAICASPVCFPSRTSTFTGLAPTRSGAISNFNWGRPWRFYAKGAITIPKYLQKQGWKTFGAGKNLHGTNRPEFQHYFSKPGEPKAVKGTGYSAGPLGWGVAKVPYEKMPDHLVVNWGIKKIQSTHEPIFLSVGIYKPHVKWILPQSSFDKYPLESFQAPETLPADLADLSERLQLLARNEAKFGKDYHKKLVKDKQVKAWARAYLAAVTFADEQLGRLLDAWESSPHAEQGMIVLWSDHGFMLGEKTGWGKFKPWYDAVRVNLVFAGPGIPKGITCDKAVSLLDLYPTLVDMLGLKPPPNQKLDGKSLRPLIENPDSAWNQPVVMSHEEDGIRYDVVMDNQCRMTSLITGEMELYDLEKDPHEWNNLANNEAYSEVIERLSNYLTFQVPRLPDDGWLEAESIPCQTSADFGRRGNFHYPREIVHASNGRCLVTEFKTGEDAYIDFVVRAEPGVYEVDARFGPMNTSPRISVSFGEVKEDAKQATAEYTMHSLYTPKKEWVVDANNFATEKLGKMTIKNAGLHIIRFKSTDKKMKMLRIDCLKFRRLSPNLENMP